MTCPDAESLAAGDPDVAAHLAECAECARIAAAIASDDDSPSETIPSSDEPALGEALGRYILVAHLGSGGMGVVAAAYDPQLDRNVALKWIRADKATPAFARRFEREAQTLARLVHPHVVRVYDAGIASGRPFLAMELVDGLTLRAYLASEQRATDDIVRIFSEVARGLAAVHEAGWVHRDVKPDNILIDRAGTARLADFGLASAIEDSPDPTATNGSPASSSNDAFAAAGTPAYMAPEQQRGTTADARSDQWSWGTALAEALDGRAIPARVRTAIARATADDPAARFTNMTAAAHALAAPRTRWWPLAAIGVLALGGAIAAVAFARSSSDIDECIAHGAALAHDWDATEPAILVGFAATGHPAWRARLEATAHSARAIATQWSDTSIAICRARGASNRDASKRDASNASNRDASNRDAHNASNSGTSDTSNRDASNGDASKRDASNASNSDTSNRDAHNASNSGTSDTSNRDASNGDASKRDASNASNRDASNRDAHNASNSGTSDTSNRDASNRDASKRDASNASNRDASNRDAPEVACLAHQRDVARALFIELARADRALVDQSPIAVSRLPRAALCRDANVIESLHADASVEAPLAARFAALQARAALRKPAALIDDLDAFATDAHTANAAQIEGEAKLLLGEMYSRLRDDAKAREVLEEAAQAAARARDDRVAALARLLQAGQAALLTTQRDQAETLAKVAQAAVERAGSPVELRAQLENVLGAVAWSRGDYASALEYYRATITARAEAFGADDPRVAAAHQNAGQALAKLGKKDEARAAHETALAIMESALGSDHPDLANAVSSLGMLAADEKRFDEAQRYLERARDLRMASLGPDHPEVATSENNLGKLAQLRKDLPAARAHYERSLAIQTAKLGPNAVELALPHSGLGAILADLELWKDALPHLERAIAITEAQRGADHPALISMLFTYANIRGHLGDAAAERALLERAQTIAKTKLGPDHAQTKDAAARLAALAK